MSEPRVHLNGRLVPRSEARVHVADAGFLHGASTFTTMRAHNGVVFRFARHLRRLMETVRFLGLRTDADPATLTEATYDLLAANELREARVRITLTSGAVGSMRETDEPYADGPTTLITAEPVGELPDEWYERGIAVVVTSFRQTGGDPTAGHKTGCYFPRVLARREAAEKGAAEALWYTTDNRLAEACFCNVFLVRGQTVLTPPRHTPVLPGVVREAVMEICRRRGIEVDDETPLTVRDMLEAEEMFLTSSVSGIRPVVRVERHEVDDGKPGELTRRISADYGELLQTECQPTDQGEAS